jgi:flavin prenyltransferase
MGVMKKLIIGITGGSCSIYAVALLKILKDLGIETHVIVSRIGEYNLNHECEVSLDEIESLSSFLYRNDDMAARIASGSFKTDGMIIVPCSMSTVGAVANGLSQNLIHRAADVVLKEGRKLVVVFRESPLSRIHLENLLKLSTAGATVMPAAPGFYNNPEDLSDIVGFMVTRILDQLQIEVDLMNRWI